MDGKKILSVLTVVAMMSFASSAFAEWNFGIGTGPQFLSIEGDIGTNTALGPVTLEIDLDPEDISDITESAIGLTGYATNGTWMVQYLVANLELEDSASRATGATATVNYELTAAELTAGYFLYKTPGVQILAYTGARYTEHAYEMALTGVGFNTFNRYNNFSNDWTDALLGVSLNVPLTKTVNWNVKADGGFGGSEGTYLASTSVTWRFWGPLSATLAAKYVAVEYENESEGHPDWYLYDVDESSVGLVLLYNF